MEFIILRSSEINFSPYSPRNVDLISKSSKWFETGLQATVENDGNNSVFLERLSSAISKEFKGKGKLDWSLQLTIGFPAVNPVFGLLRLLAGLKSTSFLEILHNLFGKDNIAAHICVKEFGLKGRSNLPTTTLKIEGLQLKMVQTTGRFDFFHRTLQFSDDMIAAWNNKRSEFCGLLTISLVLNASALCSLHSMNLTPEGRFGEFKNALEDEICTDTKIIVGIPPNQVTIKCHRMILAAGSSVFRKMFESGMKESTGDKLEMKEISEKGVRAFLAYLYYRGIKDICENSEVAVEVLQAAEKYDVKKLKDVIDEFLVAQPSSWFSVDAAVGLLLFSKALSSDYVGKDDGGLGQVLDSSGGKDGNQFWESLKMKSLKVLKWYSKKSPKKLMESEKYQEIFSESPQLGMEIGAAFLQMT